MTYFDSPSRLLSEITSFVLNGASPMKATPSSHPTSSSCGASATYHPEMFNLNTINGHLLSPVLTKPLSATMLPVAAPVPTTNDLDTQSLLATALQHVKAAAASEMPLVPLSLPVPPCAMNPPIIPRQPRRALKDDLKLAAQSVKHIAAPSYFALVEFKRQRVRLYKSSFPVSPGSYVVIAGDRGEDMGLCVWIWHNATASRDLPLVEVPCPGRNLLEFDYDCMGQEVRRIPTPAEIHVQNFILPSLEIEALRVCREKALTMKIPIDVIDVEYQFDRKKITYYFVADGLVDFRVLVRELWHYFNTRIWLEKVPRIAHSFRTQSMSIE